MVMLILLIIEIIVRSMFMVRKRKPIHPGFLLKEEVLVPLGLSITEAAKDLEIGRAHV